MPRFGDETEGVKEWVYGKIVGDPVLPGMLALATDTIADRVWDSVAPEGTNPPWITFQVGDADDVRALGPDHPLFVQVTLQVKVIGRGETYTALSPIARRLADVLHGTHNDPVSNDGMILTCLRRRTIQYPEQGHGLQYRHLGAIYEVNTQ